QPEASDLWLFSKTTSLRDHIDRMTVLLTPSDNTRTWYKIDKANFTLTLYSSRPTAISYRLTAPRFNEEDFANTRDGGGGGFIINDPDRPVTLDNQGNISSLNGQPYAQIVTTDQVYSGNYKVKLNTGEIIEEIGAYAEAFIGKIHAGLVETENLIAKKIYVSEKIISPVVETKDLIVTGTAQLNTISTNEIKPQNGDLIINLDSSSTNNEPVDKGPLAKIIIKGLEGKTAASIDAAGNATFSGTLTAQTLQGQEATIAGTLSAGNIQADNINQLENNVASQSSSLDSLSTNVNDIQQILKDIKNSPLPDPQYYQNIPSPVILGSGATPESDSGQARMTFNQLTVTGSSNLYNVSVSGSILAGQTLIENNTILSLASDLKLSALNTITLFDGAVVIARDGTITTKGTLVAQALEIKNPVGETVASIDASGSAQFNNVTMKQLNLDKYMDATESGAIIAASDNFAQNGINAPAIETQTKSAGIGILPANSSEIIIYNSTIKDSSLIYITPTTFTPNGAGGGVGPPILTVVKKTTGGKTYFTVTTAAPSPTQIQFNWLIIN
ncbi:MAG: hypothetical protein V1709_01025, partial [Planctomycetota bacterium]